MSDLLRAIFGDEPMTMLLDGTDDCRNLPVQSFLYGGVIHAVDMMWQHPKRKDRYEQITTRCQITAKGKRKLTTGAITCLVCLAMEPVSSME
jgi:hypothetical protein